MKKLISIVLSVAMVMSTCSIPSHAIGYNKIVDNELGGYEPQLKKGVEMLLHEGLQILLRGESIVRKYFQFAVRIAIEHIGI